MTNATPGPVELKPCPFCGSDELSHGWSAPGFDGSNCTGNVECHNCNALIYTHGGEAEAITAWNTRADSHHRLVEALRSAIAALEDGRGLDDAICCAGLDCGCRAATHRQLLLHDLTAALREAV